MAWWRSRSVVRSLRHQAPPWHSTSAGNGPSPRGLYTRASSGLSPWRRYSTSSTSYSVVLVSEVLASSVVIVMASHPCAGSTGDRASAADLKFLQRLPQARLGTSNRKAALELLTC